LAAAARYFFPGFAILAPFEQSPAMTVAVAGIAARRGSPTKSKARKSVARAWGPREKHRR